MVVYFLSYDSGKTDMVRWINFIKQGIGESFKFEETLELLKNTKDEY